MDTKKKILALVLVLVIAAVAVVCVFCLKKTAEVKTETVSFTVINNSGKNVTELVLEDRQNGNKMVAKPEGGGWEDGESVSFTMQAAIEQGTPNLMFSYTVEGGNSVAASVMQKEGIITLVTRDDDISFDITAPGK